MQTPLPNIKRVTKIKILGINILNNPSVCGRVNNVIASWTEYSCAAETPRAWFYHRRGADDRQRLESVIRRGISSGLCAADQTSVADLVDDADDNMFNSILYNNEHV